MLPPESGGLGDHVVPYHSPNGTAGEWIEDPYNEYGYVYTGPGISFNLHVQPTDVDTI